MPIKTSHKTDISSWAEQIIDATGKTVFTSTLLTEESTKNSRLQTLSSSLGLPIYPKYVFLLPDEKEMCWNLCNEKAEAGWKLHIRISEHSQDKTVFRQLDMNANSVLSSIELFEHLGNLSIRVTPYKDPTLSGTLWVNGGDSHLEMVFGPHAWLRESLPHGQMIYSCSYNYHVLRYSTDEMEIKQILFRCFRDTIRMVLGRNIRGLSEVDESAYAEFHWLESLGYRFLDCSYSPVWTGTLR